MNGPLYLDAHIENTAEVLDTWISLFFSILFVEWKKKNTYDKITSPYLPPKHPYISREPLHEELTSRLSTTDTAVKRTPGLSAKQAVYILQHIADIR